MSVPGEDTVSPWIGSLNRPYERTASYLARCGEEEDGAMRRDEGGSGAWRVGMNSCGGETTGGVADNDRFRRCDR